MCVGVISSVADSLLDGDGPLSVGVDDIVADAVSSSVKERVCVGGGVTVGDLVSVRVPVGGGVIVRVGVGGIVSDAVAVASGLNESVSLAMIVSEGVTRSLPVGRTVLLSEISIE